MKTPVWVATDGELIEVIDHAIRVGRYALDTEFHREKTYYPQLALVQIRVENMIFLIDPIACSAKLLYRLFQSDSLCVVHAAQQDLEVLRNGTGTVPSRIFDTQLAAGFLGMSTPSLSALVQSTMRVVLPKADRLTDWLRRPLTDAQRRYAAADVQYLLEIYDDQVQRLTAKGRLGWVGDACEDLRIRPSGPAAPEMAWLRVKDVKTLKGEARGAAQALAEWREIRAMNLDIPPRRVLSDMALLAVASALPITVEDLSNCRGLDSRAVGHLATEILGIVERGRGTQVRMPTSGSVDVDQRYRSVIPLLTAWMSELARVHEIDPVLLATRQDIDDLLSGNESARLNTGWRRNMIGGDLQAIITGRAALQFTPVGRLQLLDVSELPK